MSKCEKRTRLDEDRSLRVTGTEGALRIRPMPASALSLGSANLYNYTIGRESAAILPVWKEWYCPKNRNGQ
jgi:hypothetical protein